MRGLLQDLRHAAAVLSRSVGATATVLLSLALAIGLNATFFSFLSGVLYQPLRLGDPDRLAAVVTRWEGDEGNSHSSYLDFRDLAERHPLFDGVAANFYTAAGIKTDEGPEIVLAQLASASYFDVMGVPPVLGRGFRAEEDALPEGRRVVVISHRLWKSRFGASREVIGRQMLVNNLPFTIVGVAAEGFVGPRPLFTTDIWVPLSLTSRVLPFPISFDERSATWLVVTGRMKPGVTLEQAETAAENLAWVLGEQYPTGARRRHFKLFPIGVMRTGLKDPLPPSSRVTTMLFMGLAAVVLLVACLNVASIQLARAWERRREFALRLSLGAPRSRVVRQLVVESLLLAVVGGVLGVLLAAWAVDLLLGLQPSIAEMPISFTIPFDWRVFTYTAVLTLVSAFAAGILPAVFGLRNNLYGALHDNGWADGPRSRARMRQGLVVAQVALSAVLLVGGGLAIQSLRNARRIDPGFDLSRAVIVPVDLGFGQYDEPAGRRFFAEARRRVARLPGVAEAAFALDLPLGQMHIRTTIAVDGYEPAPKESMALRYNSVSAGYFDTLGTAILRGRPLDERDGPEARPVAVVSEAFVARYLRGRDPIGSTFRANGGTWSIVGVMRDGRYDQLDEPHQPYFCLPAGQNVYLARQMLLVRAAKAEPAALAREVVREIRRIDPNLPLARPLTGTEFMSTPLRGTGGPGPLVWGPGLLALVLALAGLYGLVAYSVSQRRREFGVRIALGAQPSQVARLVLRQAVVLTLVGAGLGLVASLGLARVIASALYQVRPFEPLVFALVLLFLVACGVLAAWSPARRAVRLDPIRALRCE